MIRLLAHQIGFQIVWAACIFGAREGLLWLGPAIAFLWILGHLWRAEALEREVALVLFAGTFGVLADLVLVHLGQLEYAGAPASALFGPVWIVALWMAFAPSVNVSFAWLRGRVGLGALIGATGGCLAYLGGQRLGVVAFDLQEPASALALVGVWGVAVPLFVHAGQWCEVRPEAVRTRDD